MQIKVKYQLTFVRMAIIKANKKISLGEDVEKLKPLHTVGGIQNGALL